jgi:hypothetical protein
MQHQNIQTHSRHTTVLYYLSKNWRKKKTP